MRKTLLLFVVGVLILSSCATRNTPTEESSIGIPIQPSSLSSSSEEEVRQDNLKSFDEYLVVEENFAIDIGNTLHCYSVDIDGNVKNKPMLGNIISVVPYATRYVNINITNFLAEDGTVYAVQWGKSDFDHDMHDYPLAVKTIIGVDNAAKIVGCNLILKDDNSLWSFDFDTFMYEESMFPYESKDLKWHKVADNVEYAASNSTGSLAVVKDKNGVVSAYSNHAGQWQTAQEVADGVDLFSVFFYPNNSGDLGIELYYSDIKSDFYQVYISDTEIGELKTVNIDAASFAAYYNSSFRVFDDGTSALCRQEDTPIEFYGIAPKTTYCIVSERISVKNDISYAILYGAYLNANGEIATSTNATRLEKYS